LAIVDVPIPENGDTGGAPKGALGDAMVPVAIPVGDERPNDVPGRDGADAPGLRPGELNSVEPKGMPVPA
jgi:hypothetical protein